MKNRIFLFIAVIIVTMAALALVNIATAAAPTYTSSRYLTGHCRPTASS